MYKALVVKHHEFPGLAQWSCYKKASAYGSTVVWTPARRNNNKHHGYAPVKTCIFNFFWDVDVESRYAVEASLTDHYILREP